MKKFFVFVAGFLFTVVILGAGLAWYLFKNVPPAPPVPSKPVEIAKPVDNKAGEVAPAPLKIPTGPGPGAAPSPATGDSNANIYEAPTVKLEGNVSIPPVLRKQLEAHKEVLVSVRAFIDGPGKNPVGLLAEGDDMLLTKYPLHFSLRFRKDAVQELMDRGESKLYVRAFVCPKTGPVVPGKTEALCTASTLPNLEAWVAVMVKFPKKLEGQPAFAIKPPYLVARVNSQRPDPAACAQTGGTMSGFIHPTPAFEAANKGKKRFMLIAVPRGGFRPPKAYFNDASPPLTPADISKMPDYGIIRQAITVEGESTRFSMKVPEKFRGATFTMWISACKEGEADDACTAKAFPVYPLRTKLENVETFRLVGQNFEMPRCGMKDHKFYLHRWNEDAPQATESSIYPANPPELIEGTFY